MGLFHRGLFLADWLRSWFPQIGADGGAQIGADQKNVSCATNHGAVGWAGGVSRRWR
jgi:hypothetical protein